LRVDAAPKRFEQFKRLALLPVLVSNLYSMYGVLFLNWSVADIFFWFWCELVLTGLMLVILTLFWVRVDKTTNPGMLKLAPFLTVFSFLLILFYASLFSALAYKGEWQSWDRFPEFLAGKSIGLLMVVVSYGIYFGRTLRKPNYGLEESRNVDRLFARKSFVIIGLYLVLMCQYHWTGATRINLSPTYLKAMGLLLLIFKLVAEFGIFDGLFKRRRKN
jgi:hypothetical protein